MTAECNSSDEKLLRITGSRKPSWNRSKLAICTYNCRSMAGWQELNHLMEERKKIRCDVLGLCETRWKTEASKRWQDGCIVRLGKAEGVRSVGGIGFIVSKEWASRVASCHFISSRIGVLNVNLSGKATLKIVQTYAPTSTSDDDEVEEFYRQLDKGLAMKSTYTVVMGDFNAKVGHGRQGEEYVGRFGMGERNERGERLATMAEARQLYIGNSLFRKRERKRWT
ncbi:craniofacial development protein 2-like [Octopus sinensis]|uniref:Craniofacial development protein 2-like n=1 Tax=Octopus sinensis TaxID=2607531 RepID=A0A6P7SG01_9MOLL|nr:craniofacial development protein 2-like [Octopus sinensis]